MKKTFYSVRYMALGADKASMAWFDDYERAKEFSKSDFRDNPVRHTFSDPKKIKEAEELVQIEQSYSFRHW